jgi:colicin import membrane protein
MLMAAAALDRDAFMPRAPAGLGRGLLLALVAHALLIVALSLGVNWRASPPEGVEAELWAAVPQIAAPRAAEPEPPPPPPPPVKPVPTPEPVKPVIKEEPAPDAQIAIEKARRLEDKRKKELAEQAAADKLAKQRKEEADKAKTEKLAEQKRKDEADKAKAALTAKKQDAALAKAREAQMQRIASLAGATGDANATGAALQNAGPSASYIGRIKGRIRPNVSFPDTIPGNPKVEVDVRLAPDGRIMSSRIVKGSGVPEWDSAVLRAIERTEVLPRDEYGKVPPALIIEYQLRE